MWHKVLIKLENYLTRVRQWRSFWYKTPSQVQKLLHAMTWYTSFCILGVCMNLVVSTETDAASFFCMWISSCPNSTGVNSTGRFFFPQWIVLAPWSKTSWSQLWGFTSVFSIVFCLSTSMLMPLAILITLSFVVNLESRTIIPSTSFFFSVFFWVCVQCFSRSVHFYMSFRIHLSNFAMKTVEILTGTALNLFITNSSDPWTWGYLSNYLNL